MGRATARRRTVRLGQRTPGGPEEVVRPDTLVVEEPLEIRVGGTALVVTMRTPGDDMDLAAGFLVSEGVIWAAEQLRGMRYCAGATEEGLNTYNVLDVVLAEGVAPPDPSLERNFYTTSSCGLCGKASLDAVRTSARFDLAPDPLQVTPGALSAMPEVLRAAQRTFDRTGGLHAAGLFTPGGELLVLREDVGRHNAVDKVVGWALREGRLPLTGTVLLVSGRASFELTQKAWMAGIPLLAAVSAPSSLAADLAEEAGMTLVGFLRGETMNVYTRDDRVVRPVLQRRLGELTVSAIGLGAMPLSMPSKGRARPSRDDAVRVVHAALDAGVTLIDTADAYCLGPAELGHNEELVAHALRTWGGDPSDVLVATKGGHTRPSDDAWELDGRPEHLRAACEASLARLGVEALGLYQFHRPDPDVPWAESVGALEQLRAEGKVRLVGVSNADPQQIREAAATTVLAAVQNEFSPAFRSSLPELRLCTELGVAFLPWSPLGGSGRSDGLGSSHHAFAEVAASRGVSPQQVCLAWHLAQSPAVLPIPGASRVESLLDSLAAVELALTPQELTLLDAA